MAVVNRQRLNLPALMTRRSMSLFGPISPRAAEPKRMILSGCAASTTRRTMSAKTVWSGCPFLRRPRSVELFTRASSRKYPRETLWQLGWGADGRKRCLHFLVSMDAGQVNDALLLAQVLRLDAVVRDLGHFYPFQTGGVADRFAELRLRVAVGDDVKPVAVTAVLGDPSFVRGEQHAAIGIADPLDFDQSEIPGSQIDARDVIAQVLLGYVEDLPALCPLVFHDDAHRRRLSHRVRPQAANLGRCPVWVGQDKDRRDPFDRLEGE